MGFNASNILLAIAAPSWVKPIDMRTRLVGGNEGTERILFIEKLGRNPAPLVARLILIRKRTTFVIVATALGVSGPKLEE